MVVLSARFIGPHDLKVARHAKMDGDDFAGIEPYQQILAATSGSGDAPPANSIGKFGWRGMSDASGENGELDVADCRAGDQAI